MDLKEEAALGAAVREHWYYVSKAGMLARSVGACREVLDVGAGSGFFSRWLVSHGLVERAVCVDPGYPEDHDETENGRPVLFRREVPRSDADLVLLMDVLEHVDDDVALLADVLNRVEGGTRVLITVPAFKFIWSAHDDFLEHRRRYTLAQLREAATSAGLTNLQGHYYFGAIFPVAVAQRLATRGRAATSSDMKPQPAWLNAALKLVCRSEQPVMRWNRLAGLTVVLMGEAPAGRAPAVSTPAEAAAAVTA